MAKIAVVKSFDDVIYKTELKSGMSYAFYGDYVTKIRPLKTCVIWPVSFILNIFIKL